MPGNERTEREKGGRGRERGGGGGGVRCQHNETFRDGHAPSTPGTGTGEVRGGLRGRGLFLNILLRTSHCRTAQLFKQLPKACIEYLQPLIKNAHACGSVLGACYLRWHSRFLILFYNLLHLWESGHEWCTSQQCGGVIRPPPPLSFRPPLPSLSSLCAVPL